MAGGVFLRRGLDLIEMSEEAYALEDHLQELIERHPNLLAGDQVNPDAPRKWLLLSRETAVPGEKGGNGRWSLDHLLLDQDAIPTLVEVKRSGDTRIRREVVGQMLDYAANAVTYWNLDFLRETYEAAARASGRIPEDEIAVLVDDPEVDLQEFWERAKTNLRAGRIRLVFVSDAIPTELQRIVEFLNERMTPTEVLAVEVKQYIGGGEQMLVPRVLGQTAEARQKKSVHGRGSRLWDEELFFEEADRVLDRADVEVAREIFEWCSNAYTRIDWGHGEGAGRFSPALDHGGRTYYPMNVWSHGKIAFQFFWMTRWPPFDQDVLRLEYLRRLNEIEGLNLPEDVISKKPSAQLALLRGASNRQKLFDALEWFASAAKSG